MKLSVEREKVRFPSGDADCAAWHYPGSNGACVVMAGGFAVTKEPATDMFAKRFCDAGFAVLACDQDQSALAGPAADAAQAAPRAELVRLAGRHYAPFLDGHEQAVQAELSFLRRHLLDRAPAGRPTDASSAPQPGSRP